MLRGVSDLLSAQALEGLPERTDETREDIEKKLEEKFKLELEEKSDEKIEVVSVGGCMVDLTSYAKRQPKPGETIQGTGFCYGFGGKGANQCVQASRLGSKCAMVAVVGHDVYGQSVIKNLRDNEVNADCVRLEPSLKTGIASITVTEDGQNSIVIIPGANRVCGETEIVAAVEMISNAKVLMCQLETPAHTAFVALRLAHAQKVFTIFNPAPPPDPVPELEQDELDPDIYKYTHLLCANESEATQMTGVEVCDVETAKAASKWYLEQGVESVIITLGEKGSVLTSKEYDGVHVPADKDIEIRDTTGAGDSFIGALAFFKANMPSLDMLEIVRRATTVAGVTVGGRGAMLSLPFSGLFPSEFLGREISSKGMPF